MTSNAQQNTEAQNAMLTEEQRNNVERRFIAEITNELRGKLTRRQRRLACEELEAIAMHTESPELRSLALETVARYACEQLTEIAAHTVSPEVRSLALEIIARPSVQPAAPVARAGARG